MGDSETFVIVGAGLAGTRAATTLRDEGFTGRVVLIGDERARPYDRVSLSKHYLTGRPGFHGLSFHDAAFYRAHRIELELGATVERIDTTRHDVVLASNRRIRYDALLIATGSEPRRWAGRGSDLAGVHYLRTLADADRLRAALTATAGRYVVVVGTGWIGCEVAAAARELGLPVVLVGRSDRLLRQQTGPEISEFFRRAHVDHGVDVLLNAEVAALAGSGTVEDVILSDGSTLPADVVVFGLGATPRAHLAEAAGLAVDDGIVTDECLRTSDPHIFAAGDVANAPNAALGRRSRFAHFATAHAQGAFAARAMLGARTPYAQIPFCFSDQYDIWMECTGDRDDASDADDYVVRALPGPDQFLACWLRDGRLVAGMNINIKGVPDTFTDLIAGGRRIDTAALADPSVPLADVVMG